MYQQWGVGIRVCFHLDIRHQKWRQRRLTCEDSKGKLHPTSSPKYELPGDYDPHNGARKHTFFWNTPKTGTLSHGTKFRKSLCFCFLTVRDQIMVFWPVMPCKCPDSCQPFGGNCSLNFNPQATNVIYIYMEHQFLMFLDHTQRRSTVGRTPLDE